MNLYFCWPLACCQWPSYLVCHLETIDWQIKDCFLWSCELWKQIIAADQTVWITHVDAHNKGLFSDEAPWNQASDWACTAQSHHCCQDPSLYQMWQHINCHKVCKVKDHISDAGGTIACQTCDSCQKLTCLPYNERSYITWDVAPACFGRLNKLDLWPPSLRYQWCLTAVDTFSGCVVVVFSPVSWLATPFWPLKLIVLCFPAFWTICSLAVVHFLLHHFYCISELIVKIFEGPFMPSAIHRHLICGQMLTAGITSSSVSQFGHWMQLSPERDHFILATSWVTIRMEGVGGYVALFWKFRIPPWPFLGMMLLYFS